METEAVTVHSMVEAEAADEEEAEAAAALEAAALEKCMTLLAATAVQRVKCHLLQLPADQFTATTAFQSTGTKARQEATIRHEDNAKDANQQAIISKLKSQKKKLKKAKKQATTTLKQSK